MNKKNKKTDLFLKGSILLFLILIPVYIYLKVTTGLNVPEVKYCLNDVYCRAQMDIIWLVLPFSLVLLMNFLKYDFDVKIIIRINNLRTMWLRLCKKILLVSFVIALYIWITTTVIGLMVAQFECNWLSESSNSYYLLHMNVGISINVWEMMAVFFLIQFLIIAIMGTFLTLFWWIAGNPVFGFFVAMVLLMVERSISPPPVQIFYSYVKLDPILICYYGIRYMRLVFYPLGLLSAIILLGLVFIRRKDILKPL